MFMKKVITFKKHKHQIRRLLYPPEASSGYFGFAVATPPPCVDRFSVLMLSKENCTSWVHQICMISALGKSFSGTEISLILKNKMAAADISLKIIYLILLAGFHR